MRQAKYNFLNMALNINKKKLKHNNIILYYITKRKQCLKCINQHFKFKYFKKQENTFDVHLNKIKH